MVNKNIRKLTKVGAARSMSVVIPANIIDALGWHKKQRLLVKKVGGTVVIRDAKTKHRKK